MLLLGALALAVVLIGFRHQAKSALAHVRAYFRGRIHHFASPNIAWQKVAPTAEGLSAQALERLTDDLDRRGTKTLLVVRGNHVAWEWYPPLAGPNDLYGTAAMAKAATASLVMAAALSDGRLALDDPAEKYISAWKSDPVRSKILICDLASHASGMDDVDFVAADAGEVAGWKQQYYDNPSKRFSVAIHKVPALFPAGSRVKYSGIGYYALAYAVTESLRDAPEKDIKSLLRHRVMEPLGVPDEAWRFSYGQSYNVDGMTLYSFSSGASYTARAVARMGQLVLDGGEWNGMKVFNDIQLKQLLASCRAPTSGEQPTFAHPNPGGGWWLNTNGLMPALPRDALIGFGNKDECLLVVPSLDLVVVRLGDSLEPGRQDTLQVPYEKLFAPLMQAIVGPSSRMAFPSGAANEHGSL
jgi:CubicO group peptidase (beta-lactamase class C family)